MYFKYKLIRMKDHEAQNYSNTKNRFIAVLRSAMKRDVEKKILLAVELFTNYKEIEEDIRIVIKNMDAIDFFLEIKADEREKIIKIMESTENRRDMMLTLSQELKRRGFEKGLEEGRLAGIQEGQQEGILKNKLETAEALLKENMSVEKISQITGLPLKDIKKLMKDVHQ
jgi:predicted transposase/invertase (TIGR01784 family)